MKSSLRRRILSLVAAGLAVTGVYSLRRHSDDEALWKRLLEKVPDIELPESARSSGSGDLRFTMDVEGFQRGHFRLPNHETWRFAFLPHTDGEAGVAVFCSPYGRWRVRGTAFCCEITLPDPLPADGAAMLANLERISESVEPAD